ncbi:VCBS domain-containing protein, partial [Vibrio harveyi]|nr:VCBS domain-containing protein [Vibrio harveyi]
FTVASVDGTPSTIKVTINGTNDAATVSITTVAVDETDTTITTSGNLTSTDVDNPDNTFTPASIAGNHGDLTIDSNGHWVFTANSAFNQLNVGDKVEESFTVTSVDGTPSTIKVTINGTNDAATVSSATVAVDETDSAITTSGILTSTDVDNPDNAFTPDSINGTHGDLIIDANGHWVFTANNAFNQLNVGDKVEETFTVTSVDGTPSTIKVTINGTNDAATISSATVAVDETDTAITTSGNLTSTDVDNPDNAFTPDSINGTHGDLTIDGNGHWVFTANSEFNQLNVGDKVEETFTVTSVDGTPSTIKVTINGTNDAATVSSATVAVDETDTAITTSGNLTSTDVDNPNNTFTPDSITGTHGNLTIDTNGHWVFTTNSAFNQLNVGDKVEETFTVTSVDGTQSTVKVTINGTNDAATISSATVAVDETDTAITTSGTLTSTDVDNPDNAFTPDSINGTHGDLIIDANGHWVFTANNAFNQLNVGDKVEETFTVTSVDGTPSTIKVTINGTNDAATVSSATVAVDETDTAITTSGNLTSTDVDNPNNTFTPDSITGTHGNLTIDTNGHWVFTANSAFNQLNVGDKVEETFTVTSVDGTQSTVKVTINGTNDAATISSATVAVDETDTAITTSGTLTSTDVDNPDNAFTASTQQGTHGDLTIDANGHWVFTANSAFNQLNVGQKVEETFTVASVDGTPSTIKVIINGTNDAATVSSTTVVVDETDTAITTSGTLTSTDVDNPDNAFTPASIAGNHGDLTIDSNGHWVFTANSAFNQLNVGDKVDETFTVASVDGTQSTIKVTINGTNDRPTISGTSSGAVIEQGLNTAGNPDATGSLTATDLDKSDTVKWAINQPQGQWGTLSIDQNGHWHYQLDNSTGGAADKLAAGEHQSESFWITATDSAGATVPHKIVIDVQGSNDKPIVRAWTQLPAGKEDQPVTIKASDLLTHASDVDSSDVLHVTNLQATHGSLTDNKDGTYTFTPDKDFNGEIRLTYDVVDGHGGSVSTQAKFDLTATPDNAIITDAQTNADLRGVTEDRGYIDTHYQLHYDGKLNIQDPDAGEAQFDPNIGPQTYQGIGYDTKLGGHILLMRDGHYTYTLDNRNIQNLAQGEVKHDSAVIRSADGTTHTIELTVHGTNDAPTINAQSHSVTEGGSVLNGQMVGHDIDTGATLTYSAPQIDGLVVNPDGSYSFNPAHSSYQSLASGVTKTLTVPVTVTDEHNASSTQNLSITITGVNNSAVIGGVDTGDVTEGNAGQNMSPDYAQPGMAHLVRSTIDASGKLTIADTDTGEAEFDTHGLGFNYSGQYGDLLLRKDGTWFYHADTGQIRSTGGLASTRGTAIDQLGENQTLTDTITVYSKDGTSHDIVITIHGSNDRPYCASEVQLNSGKEDQAQTITATELLANTVDVDANDAGKLTITNLHADHGSILNNQDGTYTFTPDKDYNGQVHFTYDVKDAHSGTTHTGANMALTPTGDAALITGSGSTLKEDVNLGTAPGDRGKLQAYGQLIVVDPDGLAESGFEDPLTAGLYKGSLGGSLQVNPDGQYMYSLGNFRVDYLKEGDIAHDRFTVHSLDGTTHTLEFKIQGTNDAPYIRGNLHHAVWEDEAVLHGQLNGTDTDAGDQQHLLYSTTAHVAGFHLNADGSYTFDPSDSAYQHLTGRDIWGSAIKIPVTVTDQDGLSTTQNLSISVMGRNDAPVVSADVQLASGSEDTTVTIHASDLLTNATDVDDSETLSLSISGLSSDHGSITDNHDGTYTFTPDPDYNGPVQFSYAVKDRNGASTPAHATLALVPVDDKTQFSGVDHGVATEDVATHMSTNVNIMDAVDWQALQIKDVDSPNKQVTVEFAGQQYTWNLGSDLDVMTPYGKFQFHTIKSGPHTGEHSWSYIGDNNNVHVQELKHGESVTESIKLIATDGTEFPITVKVSGTEDGVVIDSKSELGHVIENAQTGASVAGSVAAHDTDLHDSVSWTATPKGGVSGQYGSFHLSADGQWHYDVDQSKATKLGDGDEYWEHFTIEAVSTDGSKVSQSVSVVVRGNNDVPVVSGEVTLPSGKEDSSIHLTQAQLVSNVTDIDSNDRGWLHAQNLTVDHGNVIANSDGSFTFNPDPNYNGSVHFTYDVADRHGGVTHTGANTTIAAINDAARFKGDDTGSVTEDQNVHPSVQGNYSNKLEAQGHLTVIDPDAGESGFDYHTLISTPSHPNWAPYRSALGGELEIDQQGRWHYYIDNRKPEVQSLGAGETLMDTVTVHSKDGTTHDITLTIHGTNDDPVVSADVQLGAGREDTTHIITSTDLLTHASDLDKNDLGQLSVTHLSVDHGSILDNGDGTFTLVPEPDYNGQLHFQYQVNDAHGGKAHASASMSVAAVNDRPNVQPLTDSVKEDSTSSHLVDLLTGATDKEGDVLSVSHITYSVDGSTQTGNVPDGFALGTDGHSLVIDATHSAFQHLAAGQTQQVLVNYLVGDGHGGQTQQSATLTIEGTDDKAVLTSNVIQMTESEALKSKTSVYQGNLQLTDPDTGDHTQFAFSGHYMGQGYAPGSLYIWPDGSYEFRMESATNRHADDLVDSLHKGESLEFPYQIRTSDGQRLNIIVKVIGEDDNARITVGQYSSLDNHANEDNIAPGGTHNQVWSGGNLHVIDPDHGQAGFVTQSFDTPEGGHFSINVRGGWQYTIDNAKLQHLGEGQSYQKTFTVESIDGTAQQTITVTVHGTNDTPVVTSAVSLSQGVEDTPVTLKAADLLAHASDVDDHSQLSVHNLSVDHGQVVDNLDGTFNFTPEKNYHGQVQFTYDVKDEHGASVSTSATMNLSAVNDAATFTGDSGSIDEDTNIHHNVRTTGSATIADALVCHGHLIVSDADGHGEAALDLKGQQKLSQDGTYGHFDITSRGTWVYIADNKSTPIQDLDNGQTLTDSIEITSQDGTKHSITVTISGSTDRPTIHSFTDSGVQSTGPIEGNLISGAGTSQGTASAATDSDSNAHLVLQDIQIKDPVSGSYVTVTPGHPHAIAGIGTLAIEANGHYIFTPEAGFTGKVPNMVYRVGDDGGTPVNDSSQNTLSIEVKPPAQHAPTVTAQTVASDEDQSHTFTAAEFGYQDADHDALNHITITQLPSHGLLTLSGQTVTANQQVSKADLDAGHLTFTPIQNQSGTNYAHFEFSANDGHQDSASASMVIDVNAINDAPTVGSSFTSLLEDKPHSFTKADFKYADVDGDSLHHITITNIAHGSLTLNGRAVSVGDDVAASDLASLVYTPAQNYHSVGASGLGGIQFTANDGHTDSKSGMYLINIVAVPDPATFSGDSTGHAQEDTHTQASGTLSVTDPDGSQGFISVQGGVGIVGSKGYGHAHIDSNGHWTYNLYNNHAIVQQLKQGQTDTETITVQAKDGTTHDIIITITGTNDAPTVSEHPPGSSHSVNEDTNQNATGQLDINDIDGDAVGVTVDPSHSAQFGSVQFDNQTNTWAYHLDNANPQVDALNDGDTLTDRFTLLVDDGHGGQVSKEIVMTINGHTDPVPYTPPTISVTVDTRNAHHVTAGITASTVQAYAHSIGQSARTVSGHHEIEGHGHSEIFIVQGSLHEEAELKSGNDILYIGGRLTDEEIEGGSGRDTLILGAYNRNNAPRLHSDKIGNMEIESIENIILGDGTVLKGQLPPNFPSIGHDHYEVPVNIQAHLSSSDDSVSSIRLTHLQQGLTLQSNGHNINANQDGSYTVPANGHFVVISTHPISSGHHYFETEVTTYNSVTGVTAVTTEDLHGHIQTHVNPPPPPPPPVQHDEPDFSPLDSVQDFTVTLDDSLSADAPLDNHAQVSHEHPVGAAAYLDVLGIQPNASPTTGHDQPADMDIVLAQVDQQHAADYDQTHLDMSDALEHHDAANNHNQDDEHHHHNDVDGLPDIDPNN